MNKVLISLIAIACFIFILRTELRIQRLELENQKQAETIEWLEDKVDFLMW